MKRKIVTLGFIAVLTMGAVCSIHQAKAILYVVDREALGATNANAGTEEHPFKTEGSTPQPVIWEPIGLSGGGGMFSPAISPADPNLMMLNCDMSAAYLSEDGGRNWRMIHHAQLRSDTRCRPAFHPTDSKVLFASSGGRLRISRDRGQTFEPMGNLKDNLFGEIAIHPADPMVMLVGAGNNRCARSSDGGVTWKMCEGPVGRLIGFHFDHTRQGRTMFAATDRGVWRSDDGGTTWVERTQGLPWKEIQAFAAGSNSEAGDVMLYCAIPSKAMDGRFQGGVYRSRDRGEIWESAMGAGLNTETRTADQYAYGPVAQYQHLLTTDAKPLTVYALNTSTGFHPPHSDTVYRSDDAGTTWRATYFQDPRFKQFNVAHDYVTASTGQCFKGGETPFGVAICNTDPNRVMLVRNEPHLTHDGGVSWFVGSTYPAADRSPGPDTAWVCNGLVVTTTWHYDIDPHDPLRHYIAYTDIGMSRSLDGGKTWRWWNQKTWAPWRNTCYELAFDPETPGKIWGAFSDVHDIPNDNIISERHGHQRPGGICLSEDYGASWKSETRGLPAKPVTSIVLDSRTAKGARTLYAGVFDAGVFKSTDDGRTWTLKKNGLGHPDNLRVYRVILHADGTLFASICAKRPTAGAPLMKEGVGLYRSRDRAETWERISPLPPLLYVKDFSVHPRDSQRILLGACDAGRGDPSGGLYLTEDGGNSWRRIGRQGPQTFGGYFHPRREGWIYMTLTEGAPGTGLWLSRNLGQTWQPFDELPFSNIQRVEFDPRDEARLHVTTFGGSVWRGPITPREP
ncbi:MAG TPA: hypothetical protein P5186_24710 [Candidatus Paceibacterota bacterium]|nr:hypothetical protein [Verrucomicrobiota bacterium]HRY51264.1 hypothetical protein [Candidatus Paceibacterota bacterium]HSA03283.1 hypothetical protein [Candidatus Paceibacterota bacterium]